MKASESKTVSQSQHQDQQAETAFFQMKEDSTALPEAQPFFQAGNANAFGQSMFSEGSPFFTPGGIQTKLKIGHPNDKYEVEADSMADSVVERLSNQDTSPPGENSQTAESQNASPGVPSSSLAQASPLDNEGLQKKDGEEEVQMMELDLQRKPIFESAADPTDENVQTKPLFGQIMPFIQRAEDEELQAKLVQRKGEDTPTPSDGFESRLQQSKGGGQSLPDDTRSEMEGQFGADFSGVRVHTGSEATGMSNEIGAQAFTHGNDIYFNEGKYDTGSNSGKHLLAHELTHTIQQGAVVRSKPISKTNTGPVVQRFLGIGDLLNSIARHIPGYTLITVILGKNPLTGDAVPRTPENFLGGFLGLIPGGTLLADKLRETGALAEAGNWLAAEVAKLNFTWGYIKGLISKAWDEVSIWKGISGNIAVVKRIFGEPWRRLKTFAGNILGKIQEFIFRGALKLVGAPVETIMNIINKGKAVLMKIITDPIGFFKNLAGAVGKGIQQFVKNIKKHLIGGLVTWLTGAMADIPIQLPSKWDLKGIIFLVLQILGLTYQRIRKHIVKVVGEKPVALAEKGLDILKRIVTEGPIALWEMIKEKAAEIKQSVMEGIRNWVITKLVKSAIVQVLSMLNPAGALVQAAMKIYQFVMFLYENISRIMDFVKTIFNSIGEIAMGALGKAANFIENAMAKAIPIILNFLARLINLSGVGKAVKKIIEKIRKPIDKVVGKIVKFIAKKIRKLFGKGKDAKKDDSKQKYTKKDKDAGLAAFEKEEKPFVKEKTIGKEDAKKVAKNVKKKHPVFKSISVVDGKDSWDYKYVFRNVQDTTKTKKDSADNVFDDQVIQGAIKDKRNAVKPDLLKLIPEGHDWVAIFPSKGRQLKVKVNDDFVPATLGNILETKSQLLEIRDRIVTALENTLLRDSGAVGELITVQGESFTMESINADAIKEIGKVANKIIKHISKAELFSIENTSIPRKLKHARKSKLIETNNSISRHLYRKIAKRHRQEYNAKFGDQVHHVVPLYLGGSHSINNLLKVQGNAKTKKDAAVKSVHEEMHDMIDELTVTAFLEREGASPEQVEFENMTVEHVREKLKGKSKLLFGMLYTDGAIKYKETEISIQDK